MDSTSLQKLYTFVYDLQFSPCGNYLASCDNFGYLSIFSLKSILDPSFGSSRSPLKRWKGSNGPLYCLVSTDKLLIAGGNDGVKAWKWKALKKASEETVKPVVDFVPPPQLNAYSDVNSIAYDKESGVLYVTSGASVYSFNLETQQIKDAYNGHSEYIHDICIKPESGQFLTGSEDGTVKLWNASKTCEPLQTIQCVQNGKKRKDHWVGCVSVDELGEWMVYGGSCPPTLYKLGSMNCVATLDVPVKIETQAAIFTAGRIITGGSELNIRHWARNGDPIASVPSSLSHIYSIKHNLANRHYEVLAVSGDSYEIDIFTNFGYKAFSLSTF